MQCNFHSDNHMVTGGYDNKIHVRRALFVVYFQNLQVSEYSAITGLG